MGAGGKIVCSRSRKGQVSILVGGIIVVFLLVFFVVGIDFARMYYVRGELQNAADASALAGAALLTCSSDSDSSAVLQSDARAAAVTFAGRNKAAGEPVGLQLNLANVNSTSIAGNGDIVVGNWDGTDFTAATGSTNLLINAVRVIARRTGEAGVADVKTGGNPVALLFGRLAGWLSMSVVRQAVGQGCFSGLTPVSVNEYWMGDGNLGGGGNPCGKPYNSDPDRSPYGIDHVYPDSFVRPPCDPGPQGQGLCLGPPEGNVGPLIHPPLYNADCKGNSPITVYANGPLTADCSGDECRGRPTPRSGRVFAIVGASAANPFEPEFKGIADLDDRINNSKQGVTDQWYHVSGSTFTPVSMPQANSTKDIVKSYIDSGTYPNVAPTSVSERFQSNNYPAPDSSHTYPDYSGQPFASTAIYSGAIIGNTAADFYDNNYSNGKYAPGKKILAAVYDGIVGGNGSSRRITIVGFAMVTIFGYGNGLNIAGPLPTDISVSGTNQTMYGYVANMDDALKGNVIDLPGAGKFAKLVK
jgi:Flp pilus assembly protein TadG